MSSRSCATISTACGAVNHNCITKSSEPAARPARRASLIATLKAEIPIRGGTMRTSGRLFAVIALSALAIGGVAYAQQSGQASNMSFFVTSTPIGKGADLGGLDGADKHCQQLAQAAGAGSKTWHAYLSTQARSEERRGGEEGRARWA